MKSVKKTSGKKYQVGGAKETENSSMKKGGVAKTKAAYGMAVKPGMMKKGGTMKRKK